MLEFAEEREGWGDNFYSGDVADHGGEMVYGGAVIHGDEEYFSGRGLGEKSRSKRGGEKGEGELHRNRIKVPGMVKFWW